MVVGSVIAIAIACGPKVQIPQDDGGGTGTAGSADDDGDDAPGDGPAPVTTAPSVTTGPPPEPPDDDTGVPPSVSTTTTTTTGPGESGELDEVGFLDGFDPGGLPIECSTFEQDCPRGEKCMPWANDGGNVWNATRCSPVFVDPGQPGDPCQVEGGPTSGIDTCDLGVMCWFVDPDTNEGLCVALCGGTHEAPSCTSEVACLASDDNVFGLCFGVCDPLADDCGPGSVCIPLAASFTCAPADGSAGYGEPCADAVNCAPGLACAADAVPDCSEDACCTNYCDITIGEPDSQCPDIGVGQTCASWWSDGMAPLGLEHVGVCILP